MTQHAFLQGVASIDIDRLVADTDAFLRTERNESYPRDILERAISRVVDERLEGYIADLPQMLTNPRSAEFHELERILAEPFLTSERVATVAESVEETEAALITNEPGMLTGKRRYSPERFAAMIEFIAHKGRNIFQTNLNKLLFYSDFWFFYLQGFSISGAVYKKLPFGPVFEGCRPMLDELERKHRIRPTRMMVKGKEAKILKTSENYKPSTGILTEEEKRMLDWTIEKLGHMTSEEISEFSHMEMAWKSLKIGEPISYQYAKFFKLLPPKDLLER